MSYGNYDIENTSRKKYIDAKLKILKGFEIPITFEVKEKLLSLYPNDVAIENYTHSLIVHKVHEDDEDYKHRKGSEYR